MLYTVVGSLFLIIFGFEIAYNIVWLHDEEWQETEPLVGNVVTYNLTGHIVPIVSYHFLDKHLSFKSIGELLKKKFLFDRVK